MLARLPRRLPRPATPPRQLDIFDSSYRRPDRAQNYAAPSSAAHRAAGSPTADRPRPASARRSTPADIRACGRRKMPPLNKLSKPPRQFTSSRSDKLHRRHHDPPAPHGPLHQQSARRVAQRVELTVGTRLPTNSIPDHGVSARAAAPPRRAYQPVIIQRPQIGGGNLRDRRRSWPADTTPGTSL